ncbi:substrate-binding domain-containing protein [Lawsonibacter celer]|uniref:substrate-binding domain-containing protein n=1 Tax=Lawsonibacter celer TaxID=2986526 RepID=UPI0016461B4E|nr:substrate-binding domain-containing protein [Lawsonibacter celer]
MKKYLAMLLAVAMILALAACTSQPSGNSPAPQTSAPVSTDTPAPTQGGDTQEIRLASHNAVIEGNPYRVRYEADIQEAAAAAKDYGLNVSYASFVSNWDAATESQQIENSINEGYDIILVNAVSSTGLDPIIEKAQDAGIIYINADCEYTSTDVNVLNVSTDQYYLGYETAKYAAEVLGEGAKVIMIAALDGNSANTDRQNGFADAIEEYGLEVVGGQYNHDWDAVKAQQIMTEILNSGLEFDGILISQCAEAALAAYDAAGAQYPKFIGFNDTGEFMSRMYELNKDEKKMDFMVMSNPPGVGATALNFGLNMILGKELKEDVYTVPEIHAIRVPSKVSFTYDDIENPEFVEYATTMAPGDAITYWLTIDEVASAYFK